MAPTTQQKILAAYNGFYGMFSLSSSFGLKPGLVVVARGRAIFYESKFSPKANFVIIV